MTLKEKLHKAASKIKMKRNKVRDVVGKAVQSEKMSKKIKNYPGKSRLDASRSVYSDRKSKKVMPE
jgi:hypothetical protein